MLSPGGAEISVRPNTEPYGIGNEGFAFRFKLPKTDLALRAVAIVNGVPELRFGASLNVPTLTEDEVAAVIRLSLEDTRPEFYYIPFPYFHPFFGRQYEYYSPSWLQGTLLGKLLSEADWKMKCLHIGAASDSTKTKFWAWEKNSKLNGLATRQDFPEDDIPSGQSIFMSCKHAWVQEMPEELVFPEEPRMKIDDQANSAYSKYITEIFDSVAFHDEPLFLKMREVPKLILAAEWLKKKGVKFNSKWLEEQTRPKLNKPKEPAAIDDSSVAEHVKAQLVPAKEAFGVEHVVQEKAGSKIVITATLQTPFGPVPLTRCFTPSHPIGLCLGKPVVPEAQSWPELFHQTVPWPLVWQFPYIGIGQPTASGGVTTSSIPVTKVPTIGCETVAAQESERRGYAYRLQDKVCIQASQQPQTTRNRVPSRMVPPVRTVKRPTDDVRVATQEARLNRLSTQAGVQRFYGTRDFQQHRVFDERGCSVSPTSQPVPSAGAKDNISLPPTPCPSIDSGIGSPKDDFGFMTSSESTADGALQEPHTVGDGDKEMDSGVSSRSVSDSGSEPGMDEHPDLQEPHTVGDGDKEMDSGVSSPSVSDSGSEPGQDEHPDLQEPHTVGDGDKEMDSGVSSPSVSDSGPEPGLDEHPDLQEPHTVGDGDEEMDSGVSSPSVSDSGSEPGQDEHPDIH